MSCMTVRFYSNMKVASGSKRPYGNTGLSVNKENFQHQHAANNEEQSKQYDEWRERIK